MTQNDELKEILPKNIALFRMASGGFDWCDASLNLGSERLLYTRAADVDVEGLIEKVLKHFEEYFPRDQRNANPNAHPPTKEGAYRGELVCRIMHYLDNNGYLKSVRNVDAQKYDHAEDALYLAKQSQPAVPKDNSEKPQHDLKPTTYDPELLKKLGYRGKPVLVGKKSNLEKAIDQHIADEMTKEALEALNEVGKRATLNHCYDDDFDKLWKTIRKALKGE